MMAILVMAMGCALADDQPDANAPTDPDGSIALSEYFATFAHQILREDKLPAKALDLSAALYQAAVRLNPKEARFSRALADIYLELNDTSGAISALKTYLNLEPADQTAMVQQIDVYLRTPAMQSLVQRLHYLRSLLQIQQIPSAVRSEVALRCARFYIQRSQIALAIKMLDTARTLNPVNLDALRMRYVMTQADALPVDRVQQLLGIMQANPAEPTVASRLAEQLAQMGLVEPSITWYGFANKLYSGSSSHADPAFVLGATSELLLGNHPDEAAQLASKYIEALPDDADGWFVWLSICKFQLDLDPTDQTAKAQYSSTILKATIAISNRLQKIRHTAGDTTATTRPIASPTPTQLPSLAGDSDLLKSSANVQLVDPYVESLTSLAWLDLYYAKDAAAADPLIAALANFLPPSNVKLRSLQAWRQMVGGDPAGALPKLRAIANNDPLAAMGVLIAESSDPVQKDRISYEASKLINEHPSGIIGAVLWAEFSRFHIAIAPSPSSGAIATLVANVPTSFLELISEPKAFYQVQVNPVKAAYKYGEPILVRVSLQNISSVDLAIGDDCAVHPELWIDAHMRGTLANNIIGAAIGRLDQRLALAPNDIVSTVFRVDQDALFPYFNNNPNLDLLVNLTLVVNPTHIAQSAPGQPDTASPGTCGYSVQSTDLIAREPVPIGTDDQATQLVMSVDPAVGGDKIRLMQILYVYVARLHDSQYPKAPELIKTFLAKLRRAQSDGNPAVLSWQKFLIATLAPGDDDRFNAINAMSKDSYWQTRLLALEGARELLGAKGLTIANQLSTDTDPIVRSYAVALSQSLQQTAATQPSDTAQTPESAPASTPAVAPPSDFTPDSPAQPAVSPESSIGNPKE
jgi:tetratricopeptide (TPR) repeat protein